MILAAASAEGSTCLEPHLDMLLNTLFPQACQAVDYSNPSTVKNHNELLRCFTVLCEYQGGGFFSQVISLQSGLLMGWSFDRVVF